MKRLMVLLICWVICPVTVAGASEISLGVSDETIPSHLIPGTQGYIKLTITNSGTRDLPSVYINLESIDSPIQVRKEDFNDRYLEEVKAGGGTTTLYKINVPQDTPSGTYAATFTIKRYTSGNIEKMMTEHVLITVQSPTTLLIKEVNPASFRPGEKTTMNLILENAGSSNIEDITLSWQLAGNNILPFGSDNKIFVSSLEAGKDITVPVKIAVSPELNPGVYPLVIEATYYDESGSEQSINSTAGISIEGTTDFEVIVQEMAGSTITLSIANVGVNSAAAVSVNIPEQEYYAIIGTSEAFVGNLDSGDYSVASFQFNQIRKGVLAVEISYTDNAGNRETFQKEVTLPSESRAMISSGGMIHQQGPGGPANSSGRKYIYFGLVGIVALVVLFFGWKVKKSREK